MAHILAVDDDPAVLVAVSDVLEGIGHRVSVAYDGIQAKGFIDQYRPDLVILDITMPEVSGVEVCRRIRANPLTASLPVIFLISKEHPGDIAQALDVGGDDFVNKGSIYNDLPIRVQTILRRFSSGSRDPRSDYLLAGGMRLSLMRPEVEVGEQVIVLTPVEHHVLHYLMEHTGHAVSTEALLQGVWHYPPGMGDPRVVRMIIARLRAKLEPDPDAPRIIGDVHEGEYMIEA